MHRLGKNCIRIEFDRIDQNADLNPYWENLEERPYYDIEKNYTEGKGGFMSHYGSKE